MFTMTSRGSAAIALVGMLCGACSGSSSSGPPPDVHGTYTVDVTDEQDGCNLAGWMQGMQFMGIPVAIAQTGTQVTATVTGLVGIFMAATSGLGTNQFSGTITGTQASMSAAGSSTATQGSCTYTTSATVDASFDGNTMNGTVTYTHVPTSASAPCDAIQGCQSTQTFSGARPPP
jgi:hypothetical protein